MRYLKCMVAGCFLAGSVTANAEINVKANPIYFLAGGADVDVEYDLGDGRTIGARGFYCAVEDFIVDEFTAISYGITGSYYPSKTAYKGMFWAGDLSYFDVDVIEGEGSAIRTASGSGAVGTVKVGYSFRRGAFNMSYALGGSYYSVGAMVEVNLDGEVVGENNSFDGIRPHADLTLGWVF